MEDKEIMTSQVDALFEKVTALIDEARKRVKSAVNLSMVYTYYGIGGYIIEDQQQGKYRADYGKRVLDSLSQRLTDKYGPGWSVETLKKCRQFYKTYAKSIRSTASTELSAYQGSVEDSVYSVDQIEKRDRKTPSFVLDWSHYLILMRIKDPDARRFYEIESYKCDWNVRQLQRQVASSLYERIALSRDKDEVMRLAQEGNVIEKPTDIIKNPLTLEFLGLKPEAAYTETKLESAIIDKMQDFLLELGKGFLFDKRQRRFTFDEDHYFVDLVFYNRLLQCFVLIDLKINKLTHQDLGQMQMYVNYYDRYVKMPFEKPTIGILLCREKKDAMVELTLPKDSNIYAAEYALYLPDKKELQQKLQDWLEEFSEEGFE
ncbi:MAG: DUF1016 family protein [Bacteroidales bacterium]|nr:DUF1016 family protein [Bacteroidales bacterium]